MTRVFLTQSPGGIRRPGALTWIREQTEIKVLSPELSCKSNGFPGAVTQRHSRWEPFHLKITSRPQPWRVGRSAPYPAGDECCFRPRGLVVCSLSASALPSALAPTRWLSHGISGVPVLCDVSVLTDHWPSPYTYHRGVWLIQALTTHVTMVYWCGWGFPGGSAVKNLPAVQELQMWVRSLGQAWQPTPVFLPGQPYGQRSLAGYRIQGYKESDTTEAI